MRRHVPLLAYALVVIVLGDWLGEDLHGFRLQSLFMGILVVAIVPFLTSASTSLRTRAAAVASVAALYRGAFLAGTAIATCAFNACVHRGEGVRQALLAFYSQHRTYPAHLSELRLPSLPGNRLLRPSILFYQASSQTFVLEFGDPFATHTATPEGWSVTK